MIYVTYVLNPLLMIAMPFVLAAFLARRLGVRWGLVWVGAVTFILSQVVHLPLLSLLGKLGVLVPATTGWPLVWYATLLGLMAGLCEELARFLVLRFWLKRDRSWNSALMFATGHGGVEAIYVGVIAGIGALNLIILSSIGPEKLGVPPEQVAAIQAQLTAALTVPVLYPLLGAFERVTAISTHLFLAVLVMQVFIRRNYLWLLAAILWHALTDGVAVFAASTWGAIPTEASIAVLAVIGLALMFALRTPEPPAAVAVAPHPAPLPAAGTTPPATTAEELNRTRFQ